MFKETVYHGTIQQKADAIVKEGFIESSKDIEWLGTGIYFFAKREDAELWAENEAAKKKNKVWTLLTQFFKRIWNINWKIYY